MVRAWASAIRPPAIQAIYRIAVQKRITGWFRKKQCATVCLTPAPSVLSGSPERLAAVNRHQPCRRGGAKTFAFADIRTALASALWVRLMSWLPNQGRLQRVMVQADEDAVYSLRYFEPDRAEQIRRRHRFPALLLFLGKRAEQAVPSAVILRWWSYMLRLQ